MKRFVVRGTDEYDRLFAYFEQVARGQVGMFPIFPDHENRVDARAKELMAMSYQVLEKR